jgi:hypothetical protein
MRFNNDTQRLRDAIEAAGLLNSGGSGPIYNDARADGTRRLKLLEAGFFPSLPQHIQWHIRDNLDFAFGDRLVKVYLQPGHGYADRYEGPQHDWSLCVVLRD